jgi:hypothetical protein
MASRSLPKGGIRRAIEVPLVRHSTPFVVITKHTQSEGVLRATEAGAKARKPFRVKHLSEEVEPLLGC